MEILNRILQTAKTCKKKIVLPEGLEERTIVAAEKIVKEGYAYPILIGNKDEILARSKELNVNISDIEIINPEESDRLKDYIEAFYELRKNKGMTLSKAEKIVRDPLYFATMMVKLDDADGMVSGAVHTTGDLLRPGLQIIKTAKGVSTVSSFFIKQ